MRSQSSFRRSLRSLECLEERSLMAVASLSGGLLKITGDNTAEVVTVTELSFRKLLVTGTGFPAEGKIFNGVNSITVDMKGGDDTITIGAGGVEVEGRDPIEILGPVNIQLGTGSDTCFLYINTLGDVTVNDTNQTGAALQNDQVYVGDSIMRTLKVNLGIGSDYLEVRESAILTLEANLGVNQLASGQTDSDTVLIQDAAIWTATINVGIAETAGTETMSFAAPGTNEVGVHASLIGNLKITGGNSTDTVVIDSEGEGIGPNIRPHLVSLVNDLEPPPGTLATLTNTLPIQQIIDGVDALFAQFMLPEGFDIPFILRNIDLRTIDLSDFLDSLLSREELSFIQEISDHTIIVAAIGVSLLGGADAVIVDEVLVLGSVKIDTGAGSDFVQLSDLQVLGLFPPFSDPFKNHRLIVTLGAGDDQLTVQNVLSLSTKFDGGAGSADLYGASGLNFLYIGIRTGFEGTIV